jgi:hypothetical protein
MDEEIQKLQLKIANAQSERDAWKDKPTEHFKMASIMVESLEKQLQSLLLKSKEINEK